jgi:hypothetical protein
LSRGTCITRIAPVWSLIFVVSWFKGIEAGI